MRQALWGLALLALGLTGCGGGTAEKGILPGGGSSFVARMMEKWARTYTVADLDYTASGSGQGVQLMLDGQNDFGCTDAPLDKSQLEKAGGADKVVQVPLVMGAIVPVYNLPDVPADKPLRFSGEVLALIYLGEITTWNDERLQKLNEGTQLPDLKINRVVRADGSGTSFNFTAFLAKTSPQWREKMGPGSLKPSWPKGTFGATKSSGMASEVESTVGSIGYVELSYALEKQNLHYGHVLNQAGVFVKPTLESVTAAASQVKDIPEDLALSLIDLPGKESYPICATVWAVARRDLAPDKAKRLADFLRWAVTDGQKLANAENYAHLPPEVVKPTLAAIDRLTRK